MYSSIDQIVLPVVKVYIHNDSSLRYMYQNGVKTVERIQIATNFQLVSSACRHSYGYEPLLFSLYISCV